MAVTRRWLPGPLLAFALAAGCGGPGTDDRSGGDADNTGAAVTFSNPVHDSNFPDPGVLKVGDTYFAYGTNDGVRNVPVLTSKDLVRWSGPSEAMPELGSWVTAGFNWAPEVLRVNPHRYVMYYTAKSTRVDLQCVGAAVASNPGGPFVDSSDKPLICEADEGGSIDASPFTDADGHFYLHWKNDGNHIGTATHLYGQRLSADGGTLVGKRARLLTNHADWHRHVIEAPQMQFRNGRHYLFYSANAYDEAEYAVGYASCDGPLGPCRDAPENPILVSGPGAAGPGHCSVVTGPDGNDWMLYHAWRPDAIGSAEPGRTMWLDRVDWEDGKPVVRGPTKKPQPKP